MTNSLDREEFVAGYLAEVDEHLRSANANLLAVDEALKKGESHHRMVRELFRSLHTVKGLSAMVGVEPVVDIAHEMENILRTADRAGGRLARDIVDLLLQGMRAIEQRVQAFSQRKPVAAAPAALLAALADLRPGSDPFAGGVAAELTLDPEILAKLSRSETDELTEGLRRGRRVLRVDFVPSSTSAATGTTITTVREKLATRATIVKVVPRAMPRSEGAPGGLSFAILLITDDADDALAGAAGIDAAGISVLGTPTVPVVAETIPVDPAFEALLDEETDTAAGDAGVRSDFVRVDVQRLDDALEKLSALVVTRFRLSRAVNALREHGVDVRDILSIVADSGRQLADLRGSITRARMVSVSELLERVPLIVRGMSRSTGKSVRLKIDAGRAELDKAVAERVFPAIVHLVRNAVDHAIESAEERRALGKPEEGTVTVSCFEHSDSQLELIVSDDGRGIDPVAVAHRAKREVPRDARGLLELITLPGLSTLDKATSSSGRGMGMDIVRRIAVDTLGGDLLLRTELNVGTSFTLRVPLSISILDSFSFECARQSFVVPVAVVEEIVELRPELVFRGPVLERKRRHGPSGKGRERPEYDDDGNIIQSPKIESRLLRRRGEVVPLFSLSQMFALPSDSVMSQGFYEKALVVRRQGTLYAFAVDRMIGQQEVVVRPLEDPLVKVTGVAGTTDLGDGKPTLVVDLIGLAGRAAQLAGGMA